MSKYINMNAAKSVPLFIYSGDISPDELQKYQDMIKFLGGRILNCKNDQFISSCTHILVFSYSSSVKVMGGLASGKWLVDKEYVFQSYKKRKWLNEEEFELRYNNYNARYRRLQHRKLYDGLICFVETDNILQSKSFMRVLFAGGAVIVNRKDITEEIMKVQLAITKRECLECVQSFVGNVTPIVNLEYIKKTLFFKHDPNDIRPFLLNSDSAVLVGPFGGDPDQNSQFKKGFELSAKTRTPKPLIIRRKKTQISIVSYFKECNKENLVGNKKLKPSTDSCTSDEIAIIGEISSHKMEENSSGGCKPTQEKSKVILQGDCMVQNPDIQEHNQCAVIRSQDNNVEKTKVLNLQNPKLSSSGKTVFEKNFEKLSVTKKALITIDGPRMIKLVSRLLIQLNTSHAYLNRYFIPVYSYSPVDIKELHHDDSIYVSSYRDEELRIVSKKVGRFKMNVLKKVSEKDSDAFEDHIFVADSLEYMKLRIQPDIVPNSAAVGSMFKHHIRKFPFKDCSDKALNIFHNLVNLHPPHDRKMRDYYLSVFQKAIPDLEISHQQIKGWNFVGILLNDLMSESCEVQYDVHNAIDLVIQLLELDLMYYNERPVSVTSLLSFRMFWIGKSQTPCIVNEAVRELIQLWITSAEKSSQVLSQVTKILSIMLEMLWKWSDISSPFDLAAWPMPSSFMPIANEFLVRFQDPGPGLVLKLVRSVYVPWQQLYLGSLAYRSKLQQTESESGFDLSFSSLKSRLDQESKRCAEEEKDTMKDAFPHPTKMQFLSLLIASYSHTMGIKYCKSELLHQFSYSIKNKEIITSDTEPTQTSESYSRVSKERGLGTRSLSLSEEERARNERDASPSGSGCVEGDSSIRGIVSKIMKIFRHMPQDIRTLNVMKKDCNHISNINFSNGL